MNYSKAASGAKRGAVPKSQLKESVGFQIRHTHRLIQRYLQMQIEPYGVTLGMWYFLRVLWVEDGLTQRELSQKVGTMEPTTLVAIKAMVENGLVERRRNAKDGRKINIFLTHKGAALRDEGIPKAMEVNARAMEDISDKDQLKLLEILKKIQDNIYTYLMDDEILAGDPILSVKVR